MKLPRLYLVTDEDVIPNNRLTPAVEGIMEAGVRLLQLRFKKTPYSEQVELGRKIRKLTKSYGSILIVNDSPELAAELEADGVHLGASDAEVSYARKLLGESAIIGVSCYEDIKLVERWSANEVAYIGLSSPYASSTKQKASVPIHRFKTLVSASSVPVYAIGGITVSRMNDILSTACYGVAVVSAIFAASNPVQAVAEFKAQFMKLSTK